MDKEMVGYILLITITFTIAVALTLIIRKLLDLFIIKFSKKLKTDPTNFTFLKNSAGFIIYTIAIVFIFFKIPYLRTLGTTLFAGAGVLAIVVGFASQKVLANIISGVFILTFKPFKLSDIIEFKDGQKGVIEEITLRHTMIRDYENRRIIIPNSIIDAETVINSNIKDDKIRKHVVFSISYDSDIDDAMEIIRDEAQKHPYTIDTRNKQEKLSNEPFVHVRVISLSDFSVDLKAFIWVHGNDNAYILKCDLLKSVKQRFDREGIEIPFPYRTVVFKKDLEDDRENA